ncbi:conserved Plasmodium membrane protein, unknown function [Plasmodium malariae]|uniref:Uncharacterized protein n=1 Tax=Plasmodium malariae TaxID=5858 RepID=A0A1A8X3D1_PLAMA|nr:conserved Plasmodium membrane protein, unknown function [Plasmodium malariae]
MSSGSLKNMFLHLRFLIGIWLLLVVLLFGVNCFTTCFRIDGEGKLAKLKKLINKKIIFHMNDKYRNANVNGRKYVSFVYIHELTLSDYIDYVLNKTEEYDCVLFLIDVESSNGVSKFDRNSLALLEMFDQVAKKIVLENLYLYNECEFSAIIKLQEENDEKGTNKLIRPVFFFYLNFNKANILPLKYVHTIYDLPEFVYVNSNTFHHADYYLKVRSKYMLENYIKQEKQLKDTRERGQRGEIEKGKENELKNKTIPDYFIDFIYAYNRDDTNITSDEYSKKMKMFVGTFIIVITFSLLYIFVLILEKYEILKFVCSYILYLLCLSGLFHCLINKSEAYNMNINLDSIFHKYVYRTTSSHFSASNV